MDAGGRSSLMVGAALGLLALLALRALQSGAASFSVTESTASGVSSGLGFASDVGRGVVLGIGDAIGVERTNQQMCDISKARGDVLGASKYCTAGDFIAWTLAGEPIGGAESSPSSQSLQLPHATDLPEGSSKAAEMYWSLYPSAVFYD